MAKYRRKLTNKQRINIIKRYKKGDISLSELAKKYNVTKTAIWKIVNKSENKITIDVMREELHKTKVLLRNNIENIERLIKELDEEKLLKEESTEFFKIANLLSNFKILTNELEAIERINKSSDMKEYLDFQKRQKNKNKQNDI